MRIQVSYPPLPRVVHRRVKKERRKQKMKEGRKDLLTGIERQIRRSACFATFGLCDTLSQPQKGDK